MLKVKVVREVVATFVAEWVILGICDCDMRGASTLISGSTS